MSVLEVRQATVMRSGQAILGPASLEIRAGEMMALIGPNGSGKSTLLRLFAGLWRPDTGDVSLTASRSTAALEKKSPAEFPSFLKTRKLVSNSPSPRSSRSGGMRIADDSRRKPRRTARR